MLMAWKVGSMKQKRLSVCFWHPPPISLIKMNIEGAFLDGVNYGGVGGLLRDKHGNYMTTFSHRVQFVTSPFILNC
ncbi:hypothetical protein RchiOBHm_Chr1g0316581 [Rosa chinensis]|uniref:RNase H type-1 domain-containing protein n=1 Tax=Rosa chinensis TaxID=74649 RepID=A0A2P6S7S2_ROSCH|nr:hypothetical protein RchiOBHm_Chr1g0316581 [Rosa chinensis]